MKTPKKRFVLLSGLMAVSLIAGWIIRQQLFPTAKAPSRFLQLNHNVDSLQFSADAALLIATQRDEEGDVTFLNPATTQPVQQWRGMGGQFWISEDSQRALNGRFDSKIKKTVCFLRSTKTGKILRQWIVGGMVEEVSRDLELLLSADYFPKRKPSQRTLITVQDVATGRTRGQFFSSSGWGIRLLNKNRYIGIPEFNSPARLLRVSDLKPVLPLPPLQSLRTSSDGNRVLGLKSDGSLHIWQLPSRQHSKITTGLTRGRWLYSLKDGFIVISGEGPKEKNQSGQSVVQVRSLEGTQLLHSIKGEPDSVSKSGYLLAIKVPRRRARGYVYGDNAFYDIWDVRTGKRIARLDVSSDALGQPFSQSGFSQSKLAFDDNDRQIVYSQSDGLLRFFDLDKNQAGVRGPVSASAGRPSTDPAILRLFDKQNQNSNLFVSSERKLVGQLAYRLEMKVLSPDSQKAVMVWNGVIEKSKNSKPVNQQLLGTGLIEVVDIKSGRSLKTLESPQRFSGVGLPGSLGSPAWSKDATKVAMADQRGRVFIWDVATGKKIAQLSGSRPEISRTSSPFASQFFNEAARLAFHPNGQLLAASREDGSIYLYSLKSNLPVAQIGKAKTQLVWMEFSPDGKTLNGVPLKVTAIDNGGFAISSSDINNKGLLEWSVPDGI